MEPENEIPAIEIPAIETTIVSRLPERRRFFGILTSIKNVAYTDKQGNPQIRLIINVTDNGVSHEYWLTERAVDSFIGDRFKLDDIVRLDYEICIKGVTTYVDKAGELHYHDGDYENFVGIERGNKRDYDVATIIAAPDSSKAALAAYLKG